MMGAMRSLTDGTWLAKTSLVGDLVALGAVLAIGMSRHGEGALTTFGALVLIFGGSWLVVTWIVGTYRPVSNLGLALALVLAVPLAVLIRSLFRDWTVSETLTVMGVFLLFSAFFIGLARLAVAFLARRRGLG
jgi:hypothetical protein